MGTSEKFWDKKAEGYAKSPISDEQSYQRKLAETQAYFNTDMHILEFGCGTGATAVQHAPYVKHIHALDISENMLEIGRGRAREAGVDNIDFCRSTLIDFNAEPASLDAVLGLSIMHLLPDRKETLAEVARILKPGGIFVSSTACLGYSPLRFIKHVVPLAKLFGLMPDLFILKEGEWANEIRDAGFTIDVQWHHGAKDIAVFIIARKIGAK